MQLCPYKSCSQSVRLCPSSWTVVMTYHDYPPTSSALDNGGCKDVKSSSHQNVGQTIRQIYVWWIFVTFPNVAKKTQCQDVG